MQLEGLKFNHYALFYLRTLLIKYTVIVYMTSSWLKLGITSIIFVIILFEFTYITTVWLS